MLSALIIATFANGCPIETRLAEPTWHLSRVIAHSGSTSGKAPLFGGDDLPVLIGPTTAKAILEHRPGFQKVYDETQIPPELSERWQRINKPCLLMVAFGSWCEDSRRWVPEIIKLAEAGNPYISIYWVGTGKNKKAEKGWWPPKVKRQKIKKVPTVWLFAAAPKGKVNVVGRIVENPPKAGQTMAEALVELLESVR